MFTFPHLFPPHPPSSAESEEGGGTTLTFSAVEMDQGFKVTARPKQPPPLPPFKNKQKKKASPASSDDLPVLRLREERAMNVCVKEPCWGRGPAAGGLRTCVIFRYGRLETCCLFSKFQEAAGGEGWGG